ncbi:MAG: hypothetical protein M0T76_05790 [Desulfobacteraceae bacterium]|nr:hypothetical protein [Desulfobacteraceae bacterium]
MKIVMDRNLVDLIPETAAETAALEALWRQVIDCLGPSRHLTPVGEYIPSKKNQASFVIEGGEVGQPA